MGILAQIGRTALRAVIAAGLIFAPIALLPNSPSIAQAASGPAVSSRGPAISLSGPGDEPALSVAEGLLTVSFGRQGLGTTTAPKGIILTSTGTLPLTDLQISTTGDFAQTNNCGATLAAGMSCQISVTFDPTELGNRTGLLTETYDGGSGKVALKGVGTGPSIKSFAPHSVSPFAALTIKGSGFASSSPVLVNFSVKGSPTIEVPASAATESSITVAAPPSFNAASGTSVPKDFKISITEALPSGSFTSNSVGSLAVKALPPEPDIPPGTLVLGLMQGELQFAQYLQANISGTEFDNPAMQAALQDAASGLSSLIATLQPVVQGTVPSVTLGTVGSRSITIDSTQLRLADQMILAWLEQLASQPAPAPAGLVSRFSPAQSGSCMSGGASTALNDASSNGALFSGDIYAELTQSQAPGCAVAQSFDTALGLFNGVAAVAIGLCVLAEAPVAAAVVAAYVVYVDLGFGGGLVGMGGTLAQTTQGAKQVVATGEKYFSKGLDTLVDQVLPEVAGQALDLINKTQEIAESYNSSETTPPQCSTGQTLCNNACVYLGTGTNCGGCGQACSAGAICGFTGSVASCGCPTFDQQCNGNCTDLKIDPNNCGVCGNACQSGMACSGGRCACASDQTSCDGQCVDLGTDPNNCGGCGIVCSSGSCSDGKCASGPGFCCETAPENACGPCTSDADCGGAPGSDDCSVDCTDQACVQACATFCGD